MGDLQSYLDEALKDVHFCDNSVAEVGTEYDIAAEICELIAFTRNQLGMTQKQLAQKSGISQANISKIENGTHKPSLSILKRIAAGLGKRLVIEFVDLEEIL